MTVSTELLVIGGGPGGYVTAIRGRQLGLNVTLVEREAIGGTCLNYGCIPSKALISATTIAEDASNATDMGIYADISIDVSELIDWKDSAVRQLTDGVQQLCSANGVDIIAGQAVFEDPTTVRIQENNNVSQIEFDNAVVSTGSRPIELPGFPFSEPSILDSRSALALEEVPDKLLIVGAGYIGMELATVFAKLDTDVTIVEMLDSILPTYDDDLTKPVRDRADTLGIDFRFGESAINWSETNEGIVVTTENEIGDRYEYHTQKMLVAVGRESVTNTVNLEAAEIQPDDNGFIPTDRQQRTEQDHIFAVGDVTGDPMLAHKASAEGIIAAEVAAGEDKSFNHASIPAAVFTEPEIASVGMTAEEATNSGFSPISGKFPFRANGRALTANHEEGFVRVVADEDSNLLLGAQIVGPEASELIGELGLAIETGATLHDIVGTIHTHPTLSEAVKEAAEHALGQSIHTINR